MKRIALGLLAIGLAWAATPTADAAEQKIRVLLTVGGHGYEEAPFYAMFDSLPGVQWTKAELPKQADLLRPGLQEKYDVLVMYDMVGAIQPEQQAGFVELLKVGIGVVSLHHNLGAHAKWDEFRRIIGGKFILADTTLDGKPYKKSTWDHDQDVKVMVADKEHPITKGLDEFVIHDEVYGGYWVSPTVHVLLKTDHPKNRPGPLAWVSQYANSRVFYLMLGHDSQAWKNPMYPKLLERGIRWAAGK